MLARAEEHEDTDRRDARLAALSMVGFWAFYFLIITVRSFIMHDRGQVGLMGPRVVVATLSMAITGVFYLFLRGSYAASMRRNLVIAASLALPAAIAYSTLNWFVFEKLAHPHKPWPAPAMRIRPLHHPAWPPFVRRAPDAGSSRFSGPPPPPAPPPPPETLDVGPQLSAQKMEEYKMTPAAVIAENAANGYFFFIAWAALFLSLRYAGEVRALERRAADLRAAAQSAELRALRYQVNPHFLFNTLNSLSSLILIGEREQAERMVLNLATFFRTSLSGDPTEDVPLGEEIALQRLYLDIEAVRFPERLRVEIDLPESLAGAPVPGLILQPLVENAVKHGVSRSTHPVTVAIRARKAGERLILSVENVADTATPCMTDAVAGNGVGLRNVEDRLAARFGKNAWCAWRAPAPGRFLVELDMPLEGHGG